MNSLLSRKQSILKVSELTKKVRFILENELHTVWLSGEISNFMAASSGHWYLSLKDNKAQVRCAMFKGNNRYVRINPQNGQQVLVKAKVSLYEPRGDFQLIIEQMEDAGEGLLRQKFEQLKTELQMEGLFDHRYKQPIPEHVATIGLITSATGAAIKDILSVLKRRNPSIKVIIYPTLVQGDLAAEQISDAIYNANERDECDVLIIGRGGGSLEDLWAFNEEPVVRAIFDCDIPTISAVGHEIDTSLSDYAADLRAATPSAAAELVSKDNSHLISQLNQYRQQLSHLCNSIINKHKTLQQRLAHRIALTHPEHQIHKQQQRCDELVMRLKLQNTAKIVNHKNKLDILNAKLLGIKLDNKVAEYNKTIAELSNRLFRAKLSSMDKKQQKLANLAQNLQLTSPLATIARGYSITRDSSGKIIKSINDVVRGVELNHQVDDGIIISKVIDTRNEPQGK